MNILRRNPISHEEKLRQEAGLIGAADSTRDRAFGAVVLSPVEGVRPEIVGQEDDVDTPTEEEYVVDPVLEAKVSGHVEEIEAMTIDELLNDSADSLARAALTDDDTLMSYYLGQAMAISTRALVLQLKQKS